MSEKKTYQQQTLFAEASLANLTVLPGSEEARKMTVTSGRNIAALLKSSDPVGLLLKMCLESEQLFSTRCYLAWKVLTTISRVPLRGSRSFLVYRLAPSMPRTDGNGCSLWPTMRSNLTGRVCPERVKDKFNNLESVVSRQMWPTPSSSMMTEQDMVQAQYAGSDPKRPKYKDALLPTPKSRDWKGQTQRGIHAQKDALPNMDRGDGRVIGGGLNPQWVEWLMGFPAGWTDLNV